MKQCTYSWETDELSTAFPRDNDANVFQLLFERQKKETDKISTRKMMDGSACNMLRKLMKEAIRQDKLRENDKNDSAVPKSLEKQVRVATGQDELRENDKHEIAVPKSSEKISADLVVGLNSSVKLQTGKGPITDTASTLTSHRLIVGPNQSNKLQMFMIPNDLKHGRDKRTFLVVPPNGTGWEMKPNQSGIKAVVPVYTKESSLPQHVDDKSESKIISSHKCSVTKQVKRKKTVRVNTGLLKTTLTSMTDSFLCNPINSNRVQPVLTNPDACSLKSTNTVVPLFNRNFAKNAAHDGITISREWKSSEKRNPGFAHMKNRKPRPNNIIVKFSPLGYSGKTNSIKSMVKSMPALISKPTCSITAPSSNTIKLPAHKKKSITEYNIITDETDVIQFNRGTKVTNDRYCSYEKVVECRANGEKMAITIDTVFSLAPDHREKHVSNNTVVKQHTLTKNSSKKTRNTDTCSLQPQNTNNCRVVLSNLQLDTTQTVFNVEKLSMLQKDACTKRCRVSALHTGSDFVYRLIDNYSDAIDSQSHMTKKFKLSCESKPLMKRIRELTKGTCIPAKRSRENVMFSDVQRQRSGITNMSPPSLLQTTVRLLNVKKPEQSTVVENTFQFKQMQTEQMRTIPEDLSESLISIPMANWPSNMLQNTQLINKASEYSRTTDNTMVKQISCGQAQPIANMFKPMQTVKIETAPEVMGSNSGNPMALIPPCMLQKTGFSTMVPSQGQQSNMPISGSSNNSCSFQRLQTQHDRNQTRNNSVIITMPQTTAPNFVLVKFQDKNILLPINNGIVQPQTCAPNMSSSFTANGTGTLSLDPNFFAMTHNQNSTPPVLERSHISSPTHTLVFDPNHTPSVCNVNTKDVHPNKNCVTLERGTHTFIAHSGSTATKPEPMNRVFSDDTSISGPTNIPPQNDSLQATLIIKPESLNRGYNDDIPFSYAPVPASSIAVFESNQTYCVKTETSHAERIQQLKERLKEQKKAVEDLQQQRVQHMPLSLDK